VCNPYTGEIIASVPTVGAVAIGSILQRARRGRRTAAALSRASRAAILEQASRLVEQRAEPFAQLIVSEAGKTITQARKEAARAVNTLSLSAAEVRRNAGEVVPFDSYQGSAQRQGWFTREPWASSPPSPRSTTRSTWSPTNSDRPSQAATRSSSNPPP